MMRSRVALGVLIVCSAGLAVIAQGERPKNVPFYTWVREDTFAGFIDNDLVRFEKGVQKVQEYLNENPTRPDAVNWMGATKVYRAVRAFKDGRTADGETLLREAFQAMDDAVARAPRDVGVRATAGGTLVYLAGQLPEPHDRRAMEKAREHYAVLYEVQSPALQHLPLHLKGELLAGVAETEYRVGDRQRATALLNTIINELPGTGYARTARAWLESSDNVKRDSRLACQSCHEPGRLQAWTAAQK